MHNPSMEDFTCCDMMPHGQVASSSERSLCMYLYSHCYIPAGIHFCNYCHKNLTPHKPPFVHREEEAMLFAALYLEVKMMVMLMLGWWLLLLFLLFMIVMITVAVAAAAVVVRRRRGGGAVCEKFNEIVFDHREYCWIL